MESKKTEAGKENKQFKEMGYMPAVGKMRANLHGKRKMKMRSMSSKRK